MCYLYHLTDRFHVGPQRFVVIFVGRLQRGQTRGHQVEIVTGLNASGKRTERHVEAADQLVGRPVHLVPQTVSLLDPQHRLVTATRNVIQRLENEIDSLNCFSGI